MYSLKDKMIFDIITKDIRYTDELVNKDNNETLNNLKKAFDIYLIPTYENMFYDLYRSDIIEKYNSKEIDKSIALYPDGMFSKYKALYNCHINRKQVANMIFESIKHRIVNKYEMLLNLAEFNLEEQFKWMIENGADLNKPRNFSKEFPIFWFALNNNTKMVKYCIEKGSDINYGGFIHQLMKHNDYNTLNYLLNERNINLVEIFSGYNLSFDDNDRYSIYWGMDPQMRDFINERHHQQLHANDN
jgi:hypothetical protein